MEQVNEVENIDTEVPNSTSDADPQEPISSVVDTQNPYIATSIPNNVDTEEPIYSNADIDTEAPALTDIPRSFNIQDKFRLPNNQYLEDILQEYSNDIEDVNLAHWSIIDSLDAQLTDILAINGLSRKTLNGHFQMSQFPELLKRHLRLFKLSKRFQNYDSVKWNTDMAKLHTGCRSILRLLKTVVNNDPLTIKKLAAVGILQAGRVTVVLITTCIGSNLFYLKRGLAWELPLELHEVNNIRDIINAFWKAREVIQMSYEAVMAYMRDSKKRNQVSFNTNPECF
ncbi:hypothetical protein RUND412_008364 [Rhizina undulata]